MAATFPNAFKVFQVFHDYTDIIFAISVNEIHDEVLAIEQLLGTTPLVGTPYTTFGGAIQDLYTNKAPTVHTHTHSNLLDDTQGNDHPQYIQVSGYPGFSQPVGGKAGTAASHLVPLSQLQSFGYMNAAQVSAAVDAALGNLMAGALGGASLAGTAVTPAWRIQGGVFSGHTDGSGRIRVPFGTAYPRCVQAFTATKLPPLGTEPGYPPYNWIEAQLTLIYADGSGATVQFSHDYSWQPGMHVSFSWIAIGN